MKSRQTNTVESTGKAVGAGSDRKHSSRTPCLVGVGLGATAASSLSAQRIHDLRTPLNQIIGYSEMLAEQALEDGLDSFVKDLNKIRGAGGELLALLTDLPQSDGDAAIGHGSPTDSDALSSRHVPLISHPISAAYDKSSKGHGVILVVDDNATNRDVLSQRLTRQGHAVMLADGGVAALAAMRTQAFDLVLLDIMMPDVDGFAVLEQIKSDPVLGPIPVVMISALNEMESIVRCIDMGADDYLCKPFDPAILKARVGSCLEKKRAHDREKDLYDRLEQNYKHLQELEKLRDDLTYMIVHDLRTPLTSVMAGIHSLDVVGDLNEDQREMTGIAIGGGETLLGMINDLLDVDKLESGSMQLEYSLMSVADLVASAVAQVASLASSRHQSLVRSIASDLPPLPGDESKLRRVLVNLLGNAIKFTPAGGTITIEARNSNDRVSIVFDVTDTGEGIPTDAFERIFEKFGQVASRQGGRSMSTGLGLAFCKLAVEAHGGQIQVQSDPSTGSKFSVTLPLTPPASA